jgi:hypothetical protein
MIVGPGSWLWEFLRNVADTLGHLKDRLMTVP